MLLVSIVGDSISTYEGFNPNGYAVFYDSYMQQQNALHSVYDTWWAKVNQALRACLCVNNSYSGSKVTGNSFPSASSELRTGALHIDNYTPDIILIYIGFNDFGSGIPIQSKDLSQHSKLDPCAFTDAYSKMLFQIRRNYPNAKIVCATLMRSFIRAKDTWTFPECYAGVNFEDYNQAIRSVSRQQGCYLADLRALNLFYETLDGTHPTKNGHLTLYRAWVHCLSELGFL